MNQQLILWTVQIRALRTELRGARGGAAQPVVIDVTVRARTPAVPATIDDCMDYQPICRWLLDELPTWPHGLRWESALHALLDVVFDADARVESVAAAMSAPGAGADALTITRSCQEHEEARLRRVGASMPGVQGAACASAQLGTAQDLAPLFRHRQSGAAFSGVSSQADVVDGPVDAILDL